MTQRRQSLAEDTPQSSCFSFGLWWTVRPALGAPVRSASLRFQRRTVRQHSERQSGADAPLSTATRIATVIPSTSSSSASWSYCASTRYASRTRYGLTSRSEFVRWSGGLRLFHWRVGCPPLETMSEWPNHALQRTRPSPRGFKRHLLWAGSLSLGR